MQCFIIRACVYHEFVYEGSTDVCHVANNRPYVRHMILSLCFRLLYFFLSALVNGEDDGKSEAGPKKDKESVSVVISLLQSIKCLEDAVDSAKTKVVKDLSLSFLVLPPTIIYCGLFSLLKH